MIVHNLWRKKKAFLSWFTSFISCWMFLLANPLLGYCYEPEIPGCWESEQWWEEYAARDYVDWLICDVRQCVNATLSGTLREEIGEILDELSANRYYADKGSYRAREQCVTIQAIIEHLLSCAYAEDTLVDLVGVIHAPFPCSPLCVCDEPYEPPIWGDTFFPPPCWEYNNPLLDRAVALRSRILREYMNKGGELIVTYPWGGLERRSPLEQYIYFTTLETYADVLCDWELDSSWWPSRYTGATYLFRYENGEIYAFSIQGAQVGCPDDASWKIWLGRLSESPVQERVDDVFNFLSSVDGPDIRGNFVEELFEDDIW